MCCYSADLRRPRSEPSNYYSSEGQRDLPLAKKHKPNPELLQTRPDKAMSVPLSLEQQQLHKLSTSPKSVSSEGPSSDKCLPLGSSAGTTRWTSRESFSGSNLGRKAVGGNGSGSLGKEKLVSRLRQRDQLGMLVMADREMADAELLSYREDLENQDCLTQMDDLQVRQICHYLILLQTNTNIHNNALLCAVSLKRAVVWVRFQLPIEILCHLFSVRLLHWVGGAQATLAFCR